MSSLTFFGNTGKILFVLINVVSVHGQPTDVSNTVQISNAREVVEERLIRLAWEKNPANKAVLYRSDIAENHLKKTKWSWLENLRVQGNLNEFTLQPAEFERSVFFPRYNLSLGFSIGEFITTPYEVKKMRGEYEISKLDVESQKLLVRTEVLKRYNHYLSVKDQLSIHKRLESETKLNLELVRTKFDKGVEAYQTFSTLMERHYTLQMRTKELEELVEGAKLDIEAMIATKLETVL